jgi:hypothetical protein
MPDTRVTASRPRRTTHDVFSFVHLLISAVGVYGEYFSFILKYGVGRVCHYKCLIMPCEMQIADFSTVSRPMRT